MARRLRTAALIALGSLAFFAAVELCGEHSKPGPATHPLATAREAVLANAI